MTSKFEGFGMVLAESASYGLPGVAFDINAGPSDIISNGESGFLVEDNDLEAYAVKLKCLMLDETLRQKFGLKSKEIVSAKFSKEVVIGLWRKLFDELLS
jgi:glycosyltransferase involved in cell wall biosynthesis